MAWKEIVRVPEPVKKRLFIPAEELTMPATAAHHGDMPGDGSIRSMELESNQ